jgi:uncharacterized protein YceH (UPF0502 family)
MLIPSEQLMTTDSPPPEHATPRWHPLGPIERRVLGVLIEKAKTTPENYPLSLNSLKTGCNQKNNRAPLMQLEEEQVDEALESLRKSGAVAQIQGGGRVDKYRHLAYEWLGVEKVELAVMAELLLRGTQTVGELRGRAARMEPIKDLADLQPTLDALHAKGLIVYLSPPGRGSLVTHTLFLEREMEKVHREAGLALSAAPPPVRRDEAGTMSASSESRQDVSGRHDDRGETARVESSPESSSIFQELQSLRQELGRLHQELTTARGDFEHSAEQFRRELDELNRQLGN